MKVIAKTLIVIVVLLMALVVVMGPGRIVAGAEYPFGVGPWSSTGHYCHDIYEMTHFVGEWKRSGQPTLSTSQKSTWLAFERTLTKTGPHVPRADFTAWYRSTGNVVKRMTGESALINTWWNQNCTNQLMEAPASLSRAWSGMAAHAKFAHYPKNVIQLKYFIRGIK